MERRKFLAAGLRGIMIGGLFTLSGFLALKRSGIDGEKCSVNPVCNNCYKFSNCNKTTRIKLSGHE